MKLHLCLLYSGGPTEDSSIKEFLQEQLRDPFVQDTFPSFLRSLWTWFILFFRARQPRLEGPCHSYDYAQEHSLELGRLLGPDFICHPIHHFGRSNMESVLKSIPQKSQVVLIPLIPHRCQTLFSVAQTLRRSLKKKHCTITEIGHYATKEPFIHAMCTQIRRTMIAADTINYGFLFVEQRQPERWNKSSSTYKEDVQKTVRAVMTNMQTQQPHIVLHTHATSWKKTLQDWKRQSIDTIITIPTSWIVSSELLRSEQEHILEYATEQGMRCLHSDPIQSPVFDNFIVEMMRDIFEEKQQ